MPSSMIFLGLVVVWLLILVPAVARHRQEVARPSTAALSGRVLDRPRRARELGRRGPAGARELEVDVTEHDEEPRSVAVADEERPPAEPDPGWERPPPRYRPGRGGFDPVAAALTARARYAFRQRVVLAMLVSVVVTALAAGFIASWVWWLHATVDLALVAYLAYLRRQVRLEESIRERRAARMAGTRRPSAAEDPDLDEWAHRGRMVSGAARQARRGPAAERDAERESGRDPEDDPDDPDDPHPQPTTDEPTGTDDDLAREQPERVAGTGAPLWRGPGPGLDMMEVETALPRMPPVPSPPLPAGTALVEADLDDPELHDLDGPLRPDYRRAVGE